MNTHNQSCENNNTQTRNAFTNRSLRILSSYLVHPNYICSVKFRRRFTMYWHRFMTQFKPTYLNCLVLADVMYYMLGVFQHNLNPDPERDMWFYQRTIEALGMVDTCKEYKLKLIGMKTQLEEYLMSNVLQYQAS